MRWFGAPTGTVNFALICNDPDAPREKSFVYRVAYNIPAPLTALDFLGQRESRNGNCTMQGKND
ncbi:MAG: hypothetical protein K2X90_01460 [Candidatus Babeliaceae bacterium]|nr:hypothetical protein [Candidatus Babeliaceae bacterium]